MVGRGFRKPNPQWSHSTTVKNSSRKYSRSGMEYTAVYSADPHRLQTTVSKRVPRIKLDKKPKHNVPGGVRPGLFIISLLRYFVASSLEAKKRRATPEV